MTSEKPVLVLKNHAQDDDDDIFSSLPCPGIHGNAWRIIPYSLSELELIHALIEKSRKDPLGLEGLIQRIRNIARGRDPRESVPFGVREWIETLKQPRFLTLQKTILQLSADIHGTDTQAGRWLGMSKRVFSYQRRIHGLIPRESDAPETHGASV